MDVDASEVDALDARYGRRRRSPRRTAIQVAAGVLVATLLVAAFWWWSEGSKPTLRWTPISYTHTDTTLTLLFSVTMDPGSTAICRITAQDRSGAVIGTKDVTVPGSQSDLQQSVTLETRGAAVTGTVDSCVLDG